MKKLVSALCALAILTGAGAAMAANTIGTIKYIDTKDRTFTFDSGTTYKAEKSVDLQKLKVGEQVMVTWDMKNGVNEASHIKAQ
jgi:Skp family chaperone for outer membrane proteins